MDNMTKREKSQRKGEREGKKQIRNISLAPRKCLASTSSCAPPYYDVRPFDRLSWPSRLFISSPALSAPNAHYPVAYRRKKSDPCLPRRNSLT